MASGRYLGRGARPGDWYIFCARGHTCWASDAVRLPQSDTWVCREHWEPQPALERLPAPATDDTDVPFTRGSDLDRNFLYPQASAAYVVCDYVEDGALDTSDLDTNSTDEYVFGTGLCATHNVQNRRVALA